MHRNCIPKIFLCFKKIIKVIFNDNITNWSVRHTKNDRKLLN